MKAHLHLFTYYLSLFASFLPGLEDGGQSILWCLWFGLVFFSFIELKRGFKHSLLGFFVYLYNSALTYYFVLPLPEWIYLFMTWKVWTSLNTIVLIHFFIINNQFFYFTIQFENWSYIEINIENNDILLRVLWKDGNLSIVFFSSKQLKFNQAQTFNQPLWFYCKLPLKRSSLSRKPTAQSTKNCHFQAQFYYFLCWLKQADKSVPLSQIHAWGVEGSNTG